MGAENLCHQAILVNHSSGAVAPEDPEVIQVRDAIGKLHSYDVPECIEITIEDGSAAYLEWICSSVSQTPQES